MMKKILVTGCNGQLGRAIRAEYAQEEVTFINTDVVERTSQSMLSYEEWKDLLYGCG